MKKEDKIALGILALTFGVLALSTRKKKKVTGETSSFDGIGQGQVTQFVLTNNTNSPQTVNLFDSWGGSSNPNVGISPAISFFNNSLNNQPKYLNYIMITANSTTPPVAPSPPNPDGTPAQPVAPVASPYPDQATTPINKICKDSSGSGSNQTFYPMVSAYQVRGNMTTAQLNFWLDGSCYLNYTINPLTTVNVTLNYFEKAQIERAQKQQDDAKKAAENAAKSTTSTTSTSKPVKAKKKHKFLWWSWD